LQNTLADVFSGLAINIEHPFRAGDWITLPGGVEGEVMEINWRATRIRSAANDLVVVPNSVIAKFVVTNHRPLNVSHVTTIDIEIDNRVSPARVINALQTAAATMPGVAHDVQPTAYASRFSGKTVVYQLCFGVAEFTSMPTVQSAVIIEIANVFRDAGISIGSPSLDVRVLPRSSVASIQKP